MYDLPMKIIDFCISCGFAFGAFLAELFRGTVSFIIQYARRGIFHSEILKIHSDLQNLLSPYLMEMQLLSGSLQTFSNSKTNP